MVRTEFDPRVIRPASGEEVWVQAFQENGTSYFEVGVQLNSDQYTYLELSREQLEEYQSNIAAALIEAR